MKYSLTLIIGGVLLLPFIVQRPYILTDQEYKELKIISEKPHNTLSAFQRDSLISHEKSHKDKIFTMTENEYLECIYFFSGKYGDLSNEDIASFKELMVRYEQHRKWLNLSLTITSRITLVNCARNDEYAMHYNKVSYGNPWVESCNIYNQILFQYKDGRELIDIYKTLGYKNVHEIYDAISDKIMQTHNATANDKEFFIIMIQWVNATLKPLSL